MDFDEYALCIGAISDGAGSKRLDCAKVKGVRVPGCVGSGFCFLCCHCGGWEARREYETTNEKGEISLTSKGRFALHGSV